MAEYREFYLTNKKSEIDPTNIYCLTNKNFKRFLNTPKGLGFEKSITTKRIGNTDSLVNYSYKMPTVTGELIFYDNVAGSYQDYIEFVKFISVGSVKLHYLPPNALESVYIECEVTKTDKGEIDHELGVLKVPVTFTGTSLWLSDNLVTIVETNKFDSTGKYYDLTRPYAYSGTSLSHINILNEGTDEIGFTFEIEGEVTNPEFTIFQNGELYGTCKLNGNFDYVLVDSTDLNENIILKKNNIVLSNPSSYQDLSLVNSGTLTFIKIKPGESVLSFNCSNIDVFNGTVTIKYHKEFISY